MVISYYLHMISSGTCPPKPTENSKGNFDISGYYSNVLDIAPRSSGKSLCRICLREGSIPIEGNRDIAEALAAFANVTMSESKDYPKHLCDVCHKFLKGAVMFRKRAKLTNKILKKSLNSSTSPVKKENMKVKIETTENDEYPDVSGTQNDDSDTNNVPSLSKETEKNKISRRYDPKEKTTCTACNKTITRKYLQKHMLLHDPNREGEQNEDYDCDQCRRSFRFYGTLQSHKQMYHDETGLDSKDCNNKRVTCSICNKSYNRKYLKMHMSLHNPDDYLEHICEVCGKSFKSYCQMRNHRQRYHKPRKPKKVEPLSTFKYKCEHCPHRVQRRWQLDNHMAIHRGVKEHSCPDCNATFNFKSNLRKHMLTHKGPQIQCESCNKMFYTQKLMKKHIEAEHLGILVDICNICGKAFGHRNQLRKHQRAIHKVEKINLPLYLRAQLETETQNSEPTSQHGPTSLQEPTSSQVQ